MTALHAFLRRHFYDAVCASCPLARRERLALRQRQREAFQVELRRQRQEIFAAMFAAAVEREIAK